MILSAIPLAWRLGVAAVALAVAAYGGWCVHGRWVAGDIAKLQAQVVNATQVAVTCLADQSNSRVSLGALEAQIEACQHRTAEAQTREAAQLEQRRKARPATPANSTRQDAELIEALNVLFVRGR